MLIYAIEYVSGGFSDGFTLEEVEAEMASGNVKDYFPIVGSRSEYNEMFNIK